MIAWKKVWEWDFESVWGILNKIEYANQINDRDLKNELKLTLNQTLRQEIKTFNLKAFMLDYDKLKELYNIDIIEKQKRSINYILYPFNLNGFFMSYDTWYKYKSERWFHDTLYYCPECKKPIPYGLSGTSARTPFSCVCGYKLFDMPIEDAYSLWCNQDLINTKIRVCSEETSMAIIKPTSQYLMGIYSNKLTNKISDICNNQKSKSDYFFIIKKHNDFLPCYSVTDNSEHSYYDIDLIYWKAIQVVERHLRRTMRIKVNSKKNNNITDINIDTVAYSLFVKYSEGVNNVQQIHSSYMKERRLHEYVGWWNDWGPKHILNELLHLDSLYTRYPKKMKMLIYHNIIYRLFALRLLHTFKLILDRVKKDFEELNIQNDTKLNEYYNDFPNDIVDNTNYILELNNNYGNLWCITEQ